MSSTNFSDQDQQQQQDQQSAEYNNGSTAEMVDTQQTGNGEANQFAMDVNLNSFQNFSQADQSQDQSGDQSGGGDPQQGGGDQQGGAGGLDGDQQQRRPYRRPGGRGSQGGDEDEEKDILNKIFVGGIHPDTTEDSLKEHFAKYGTIIDHVIIKDPTTKRSRGFGFVKYSESAAVDEVMKNRPHVIDNKKLDVKRSTPRKDAVKMESSANVNKLFVGGLDESVLEEDLREYFGQFGNITEVVLKAPKEGVRVRAFAFITYDDYDPVDKVIITKNHTLKALRLTVRKGYSDQQGGNKFGGGGGGMGGGPQFGGYGGQPQFQQRGGGRGGFQMQQGGRGGRGGGGRGGMRGGRGGGGMGMY